MDITLKELSPVKKELTVVLGAEEINKQRKIVEKEYSKYAKIPGFRPGKIPSDVLETRFGPKIDHEIKQNLIRQAAITAIQDKELVPLGDPVVEKVDPLTKDNFSFTFTVEIRQELEITDYKGVEIEQPPFEISDGDVQETLERMANENAVLNPREENATVEKTDVIETAIATIFDGKPSEDPKTEQVQVDILDKMAPGIAAKIVGAKVGDKIMHEIDFPKPDGEEVENQSKIEIEVPIQKIYKRDVPELNDEFAKTYGDADTLGELKDKIKESLKADVESQKKSVTIQQIIDKIVTANPFSVPEILVNRQLDSMIQFDEKNNLYYYRVAGRLKQTDDLKTARGELWETATSIVKQVLILDAVANTESIEIDEKELDDYVKRYAVQNKMNINKAKAKLKKTGEWNELLFIVRNQKVREFLLENATITEFKVGEKEKEAEEEEEKQEEVPEEKAEAAGEKTEEKPEEPAEEKPEDKTEENSEDKKEVEK